MNGSSAAGHEAQADDLLLKRRQRLMGPAYRHFYRQPLHLVRAEGVRMWDAEGREYLDFYNNVPSVGHCHPRVVDAIAQQAAVLNTHTRYLNPVVIDYAETLLSTFPSELSQVMFTCTGSEANDLALRICRAVTGNTGILVVGRAYHGVTGDLAEISPSLGPVAAHVRVLPSPSSYGPNEDPAARFEADIRTAIESLAEAGLAPAALIFDTVFASQGLHVDPPGFVVRGIAAARAAGAIWIADEVQSGLARPGQSMWAFSRHGVVPDIATLGKPIGNGHPVAAMVTRPDLIEDFGKKCRYFNTFGGNPVSAAAGLAVLGVVRDEGLMENADAMGRVLASGLHALAQRHPGLTAVRAAGLYAAAQFSTTDGRPDADRVAALVEAMRERGVLIGTCGEEDNCLKIRPPLPIGGTEIAAFLERLDDALTTVAQQ